MYSIPSRTPIEGTPPGSAVSAKKWRTSTSPGVRAFTTCQCDWHSQWCDVRLTSATHHRRRQAHNFPQWPSCFRL